MPGKILFRVRFEGGVENFAIEADSPENAAVTFVRRSFFLDGPFDQKVAEVWENSVWRRFQVTAERTIKFTAEEMQ